MTDHVYRVQEVDTILGKLRTAIVLPNPEGDTFEHTLDGFCWCQPLVQNVLPEGRVFIHRRSLDSPHIEQVPFVEMPT